MAQYNCVNVKLSNSIYNKECTEATPKANFPQNNHWLIHKIQDFMFFFNNSPVNIMPKIMQSGRILGRLLGPLMKVNKKCT